MLKRTLRSGFTTGACAAAAAKAAAINLVRAQNIEDRSQKTEHRKQNTEQNAKSNFHYNSSDVLSEVDIPFPDGSRHSFRINKCSVTDEAGELHAYASVIKDAGDDPDVTNGAEIIAKVKKSNAFLISAGKGVGIVTKPGLALAVGEPAINPVPRKMIQQAVTEAISEAQSSNLLQQFEVNISVADGEKLAKKTLNHRLGIINGISILGTTGIVKPLSAEAWTATIKSSMDVAAASGRGAIAVSSGRTSEKAHMKRFSLPDECYVMMGDYFEYSVKEAGLHKFSSMDICAQWAKMLKIAMATPQTHVRHGAINVKKAADFLLSLGCGLFDKDAAFNTAREIFDLVMDKEGPDSLIFKKVCRSAQSYAHSISPGLNATAYLVSYEGEIITGS